MADERPSLNGTTLTVEQVVPLQLNGTTVATVGVTALPTAAEGLVITPVMGINTEGDQVDFADYCTLTHTATGRSITNGSSTQLRRLATELARFDWTFTDPEYFSGTAHAETLDEIRTVIRTHTLANSEGSGPIHLMGDSDEMAAARGTAPAHTLLREHIDWWLKFDKARPKYPDDANETGVRAWHDSIAVSVEGYGIIHLLATLYKSAPDVADNAARALMIAWDSGELGGWVYQWAQELTAGKPLTLYGIPAADPLVPLDEGGFASDTAE